MQSSNTISFWKRGLVTLSVSCLALFMASPVLASAFEFFTDASAERVFTCFWTICSWKDRITYSIGVSGNGNYYEYRSVYQITSSSTPSGPLTLYYELNHCRKEGRIGNGITESCDVSDNGAGATPHLGYRITTNWSGCGGYTPTPDVANCGDVVEVANP